jgi:hypothetical protein
LTRLQTSDAEGKGNATGCGFIAVTACDRDNETAILRTIDRHYRIGAEERGNQDVAYGTQAGIVGTGELGACIPSGRDVVQINCGCRSLTHIDGRRAEQRRYRG